MSSDTLSHSSDNYIKEILPSLVERAKTYDEQALAKIYQHFYPLIYRYIYYRVNHVEDAEELSSEVFVKMVRSIKKQSGTFSAWLFKIASNQVTDHYRRRSKRRHHELNDDSMVRDDQAVIMMEQSELWTNTNCRQIRPLL